MLCVGKTWSLTLRAERRLRVFKNRILREMRMGSGEGFTMRNFIVCIVPPNIVRVIKSRRLRWTGHVARMEEDGRAFKMLTGCTYRQHTFRKDQA